MIRHFSPFSLLRFVIVIATGCFCTAGAQETAPAPDPWLSNYTEAVKQAKEENKDILLLFTGTDWIEICQIFDREIANAPEFLEEVTKLFVLVELQYPEDNKLPREVAGQNQLLRDAYRIKGFPTVVLTHPDGKPFGLNGYQPIEPAEYAKQIVAMGKLGAEKAKIRVEAENLEGMEKAKKLLEGIPDLPGNLSARYFRKEMAHVIQIDEKRELEQTGQFIRLLADVEYSAEMQKLAKDVQWGKMIQLTDQYITEFKLEGLSLQKALLNKAGVQARQADQAGRAETLLSVVEIDEKSPYGEEAQRQLDVMRVEALQQNLTQ
jgi:thioredoxin-related protein